MHDKLRDYLSGVNQHAQDTCQREKLVKELKDAKD